MNAFRSALALSSSSAFAVLLAAGCSDASKRADAASARGDAGAAHGAPNRFPESPLTFSASPATTLRPFQERLLPNGLRILFVEDQALPYVAYTALIRAGSAQDPKEASGLASMTAELLDQGSAKRSALETAEAFSKLGAEFASSVEDDYTLASASSLSTNAEALLDVFAEALTLPTFADAEIGRVRARTAARIQKRVDDAGGFASAAFAEYLYGDHPYSRSELGTASGLSEIKKKNIILFYKRHYRPNNAMLAVAGKITPELRQRVEKTFGAWQPQEVAPPAYPPPPKIEGFKILLVSKPGLQQAQIRIGHVGVRRQDEDFLALRVGNVVLGGAFSSRLIQVVRAKMGLTYSIQSAFDARVGEGPFQIATFTKPETVGKTVEETLKVFAEFRERGITAQETERAKAYLKGVFPIAIETAEKFAFNLLSLRLYGVPDTYLSDYNRALDRLSAADVNRAIARHLDAKNLKAVVYAPAEAEAQLKPLGALETKAWSEVLK